MISPPGARTLKTGVEAVQVAPGGNAGTPGHERNPVILQLASLIVRCPDPPGSVMSLALTVAELHGKCAAPGPQPSFRRLRRDLQISPNTEVVTDPDPAI